jgi:chromosomal replication initiation ATPase DnaA
MLPRQLGLPFAHEPDFAAVDFLAAPSNEAARVWLRTVRQWPSGRLALYGQPGAGKSHLLHRWAAGVGATMLSGACLAGLPDLPQTPIALDDADLLADEPALLHLLNVCAEAGLPVLLAGRAAPSHWPVALPDLASRLRAITAVEVEPPDDTLLQSLLAKLLADRQLAVAPPVQAFLLARLPRTAAALAEAARRLDGLALAAGTKITLRLAAGMLPGLETAPENEFSATAEVSTPANAALL